MKKRFLKWRKITNSHPPILQQCNPVDSNPTIEHKTFTETGGFIKADDFETLWIARNVDNDYFALHILNDDEYLDYQLWENMYKETMYKKHFPNSRVIMGENPNIIFHGGCLGCMSQRLHGFDRCKGCQYFRADWKKENLHIEGEDCDTIDGDEFRRFLGGE